MYSSPDIVFIYGEVGNHTSRVISRSCDSLLDIFYGGIVSYTLLPKRKHSRKNVNGLEVMIIDDCILERDKLSRLRSLKFLPNLIFLLKCAFFCVKQ